MFFASILSRSVATDNVHTRFSLNPLSTSGGMLSDPSMSVG
eukprot:CAMPEP_0201639868 /NCGR_PEP_ID=MMETSP0493-20130528/20521_1 /ASSEMBLY_ACC=CAM_ASM_000838 /TAXON_ID=420259 /ORGANISM="Thalassiosira gravida, Strain GMp14c1" /LENGTH=40 /DNA_ID= /DNA_START= /DNA_END= /DNA_ORIENTATION=